MQNSEAVQAWIQGKMATFRILVLVSKTQIRSREFSFSSRSLRVEIINLDLVSMSEIGGNFFSVSSRSLRVSVRNSRSRLDERDWLGETLILVSRLKKRLSLTTASNRWLTDGNNGQMCLQSVSGWYVAHPKCTMVVALPFADKSIENNSYNSNKKVFRNM